MSKIPSFESLRAKTIGSSPVFFKSAQDMGAIPPVQGMGSVTTGRPDEMQAPESANQQQFENDFSSMAFQFVQDRAPALLPYMIGFEVVDRSEDGSKAVGIFGYKIDDDFYYVPVFFINNQIRGVDMILNKRTNSFLPLTENWVNYIINRHSVTLGTGVSGEATQGVEQPDLEFLRAPRNYDVKSASDNSGEMWSLKTAWHVIREQSQKMAESDPLVKEMFNGVLKSVRGVPLKKTASSKYINGFLRTVGGPEAQISLLKTCKNIKFANAALTFYDSIGAFSEDNVTNAYIHKQAMLKKASQSPKLKVVTAEDINVKVEDDTSAGEQEARQILSHGFTIKDSRPDDSVAEITDDSLVVDYEKRFSTPEEVGKYSFIMGDGKIREGFLLSLTHSAGACRKDTTAVYFPEDKVVATAPAAMLMVDTGTESKSKGGSYEELFSKAKDKGEVVPDSDYRANGYLFIGPDGQAFGPVKVRSVFKDGDDISYFINEASYDCSVSTKGDVNTPDFGNWDIHDRFHDANGYLKDHPYINGMSCDPTEICEPAETCDSRIRFCSGISRPTVTSKGVLLPDSWKVVDAVNVHPNTAGYEQGTSIDKINEARDKDKAVAQSYHERYTFGSPARILSAMQSQGLARVKLASVGPDSFHIEVSGYNQTPRLSYKEAALTLVSRFGIRPEKAFAGLDKAVSEGSYRAMVTSRGTMSKSAQGVGVGMPSPVPQEASVDPYTGIPVYQDPYVDQQFGQFTGVPSLPSEGGLTRGIADGSEIQRGMAGSAEQGGPEGPEDSMLPIDQEAQALADQAAQAGQRHVFDQAAVGGLSKVYDTSAVVDSYIPNFMDSLDRLGRVLFLFYWKHDDFNARYGSDDVVEMEDRLRGVFKQLGDLTLKLKEKAVRSE